MADNDPKLVIDNANWFARQIKDLSPTDQNTLLTTKDFAEFEKVLNNNGMFNALGMWQGRSDLGSARALGAEIPIDSSKPESKESSSTLPGLGTIGASSGFMLTREESYADKKRIAKEYADNAVKIWNDQEKKYKKNPPKKPDLNRARTAREAFERAEKDYHDMLTMDLSRSKKWLSENPDDTSLAQAIDRREAERKNLTYEEFNDIRNRYISRSTRDLEQLALAGREMEIESSRSMANEEIHDRLILSSPKQAREWAQRHNDPELYAAIERKRKRDEATAIQNQSRLSKALRRNPTAKIPQPLRPSQPLPANTFSGALPQNTLAKPGSPNTLKNAQPTATQSNKGISSKATYYSPGQLRNRTVSKAQNKVINSRIGQAIQKTRIGGVGSRLNRVNKKLKGLVNPLNYLLNLFKRSLFGSVASAIGGFISSALTAVASGIIGIGGTVLTVSSLILAKVFAGLGVTLSSVSLPLVIIIAVVIFLVVTIFSIFFAPENEGDPLPESPYPGIAYFILGPFEVPNGDSIDYNITVMYDEDKATAPLSELKLVSDVPPGTRLVSLGTTGIYAYNPEANKIQWDLSENQLTSHTGGVFTYEFSLRLDPDDDITVEVGISLLGAGSGGGGPPTTGGDCGGKYNSRNSEKGNFGDPSCDHTKNAAANYMKSLDPQNADFWYLIAECESSHWPNAFNGNAVRASGAWGMYQMGVESSTSSPFVGGNMPWRQQTENAFNRETKVAETRQYNNPFDYWQCETNACQDAPGMCTDGEYNVRGRTW